MSLPARPWLYAFIAVACAALLGYAYYTELVLGLEPCPLCMTQRVLVLVTGLLALGALLQRPARTGTFIYGGLLVFSSGAGAAAASRQLWLQNLPADQVPACGPGLSFMWETFPLSETLHAMLLGTGNCAEISWRLLGLSMPAWTLIGFLVLTATALLTLRRA